MWVLSTPRRVGFSGIVAFAIKEGPDSENARSPIDSELGAFFVRPDLYEKPMVRSHRANIAQDPARRDMIAKVKHLIKDIKFAMLTTEAEDGVLHGRPMATQESEFDGTLWSFTAASSGKIIELDWNPPVNLSYAEP